MVTALRDRFIPVALDCIYWETSDDDAGRFFQKLAKEARLNKPNPDGDWSRQGHYAATASGLLLGAQNRRGAEPALRLLEAAERRFRAVGVPDQSPELPPDQRDGRFTRRLPDGARILNVYTRILRWDEARQTRKSPFFLAQMGQNRTRTGFDHLWILPDELRALRPPRAEIGAEWDAPARLARRIARFHLVDDVRGEPPHYRPREIRRATLRCRLAAAQPDSLEITLSGRFALDARRDRSYPRHFAGSLQGRLVYDRGAKRFTRLDLYAEGDASGEGRWTPGAPEGTYRLAVAFELPPNDFATAVPPQGMRSARGYLKP